MFDPKEAIRQARQLAKENPDFNYSKTYMKDGQLHPECEYVDENGNGKCIWGQALVDRMDIPAGFFGGNYKEDIDLYAHKGVFVSLSSNMKINSSRIEAIMLYFNVKADRNEYLWMSEVQGRQDTGRTWAEAIEAADEFVPEIAQDSRYH